MCDFFDDDTEYVQVARKEKKIHVVEVAHVVDTYLAQKNDEEIEVLNRSDLFTPVLAPPIIPDHGFDHIGPAKFDSRFDMFMALAKECPLAAKMNLREFGMPNMEGVEPRLVLKFHRAVRKLYPSGNLMSKTAFTQGCGTTFGKFDFGIEEPCIFYGCANISHHSYEAVDTVVCYDTATVEENHFFRRGSIFDWEEHVKEYPGIKFICSDVAMGVGDDGQFDHAPQLRQVYVDMVRAGYVLLYKASIFDQPAGNVIMSFKPRPHNTEVIFHCEGELDHFFDMSPFVQGMLNANAERTCAMLERRLYLPLFKSLIIGEKPMGCVVERYSGIYRTTKGKPYHRLRNLRYNDNVTATKRFVRLCMERGFQFTDKFRPLDLNLEFPMVFKDVMVNTNDPVKLMNSLKLYAKNNKREVIFDDELGFYAI